MSDSARRSRCCGPGLHLILPWPLGRVRRLPYGIVQESALGGEATSAGDAVTAEAQPPPSADRLWDQTHPGEVTYLIASESQGRQGFQTVNADVRVALADRAGRCRRPPRRLSGVRPGDADSGKREPCARSVLRGAHAGRRSRGAPRDDGGEPADGDGGRPRAARERGRASGRGDRGGASAGWGRRRISYGAGGRDRGAKQRGARAGPRARDRRTRRGRSASDRDRCGRGCCGNRAEAQAEAVRFDADRTASAQGGKAFLLERYLGNLASALATAPLTIIDNRLDAATAPIIDLRAIRDGDHADAGGSGLTMSHTHATTMPTANTIIIMPMATAPAEPDPYGAAFRGGRTHLPGRGAVRLRDHGQRGRGCRGHPLRRSGRRHHGAGSRMEMADTVRRPPSRSICGCAPTRRGSRMSAPATGCGC